MIACRDCGALLPDLGSESHACQRKLTDLSRFSRYTTLGGVGERMYTKAELDAAVAAERERCAQLCEDLAESARRISIYKPWGEEYAAAIRAKRPPAHGY